MAKCCVLLSTYNGEQYLYEQLESLSLQITDEPIVVLVRDDGSKDDTVNMVNDFGKNHPNMAVMCEKGTNLGVQKSFLALLKLAPDADYYAFCDQDDYWEPNKLHTAMSMLEPHCDIPALYYSNYDVVDEHLNSFYVKDIVSVGVSDSLTQILFQNRVPGCTIVFNRKLLEVLRALDIEMVQMHDAYVLAVAHATGVIVGDQAPQIRYRQHGNNTVGDKNKFPGLRKWIKKKSALLKTGENYDMSKIADVMLSGLADILNDEQKKELRIIASYKKSVKSQWKLLISKGTKSYDNRRSTLSVRCKILFRLF